jgi:urea transport system substrate-binding protein
MDNLSPPTPSGFWLRATPLKTGAAAALVIATGLLIAWQFEKPQPTIRIGLLHALSGPMAISEGPMVEAELLAIDELNQNGGVLGRKIEAVIADHASNNEAAIRRAEQLLDKDKVAVIIGCWTSACRKSVRPTIERHNALMIYPMAFEGLERSPNIIYTGAAPNQQVLPAVNWALENLGSRFFLVGSDYVWPHAVNAIVRDHIRALGGTVVGESYIPFGSLEAQEAINAIKAAKPDVILSTVAGESNPAFYQEFRAAGLSPRQSPIISFSIAETEIQGLPSADINGHYAAWTYFQAIKRPSNQAFVERFRQKYGENRVVSDVMETSYFSVLLWARAVEQSETVNAEAVNQALPGMNLDAPEGIVTIDPATRHTWRSFHIGQIEGNQTIRIVWSADHPIRPTPFPASRSSAEWEHFLTGLYNGWDKHWVNRRTMTVTEPQP